ncbi:hypothetical protein GIB67_011420 [Kingdonia uniflora]|uniref:RNase H type-1 domain-containing protein n=1 Tax=Kingdonia uniflora TaxID=39325 RepID=A0A7J7NLH5_9MAGN|nr:hypothetical protein GIB67_011420 [Kingdonia uniflora]
MKEINLSLLMKLAWHFRISDDDWSRFMRAKFINKVGDHCCGTKGSSIWVGIRVFLLSPRTLDGLLCATRTSCPPASQKVPTNKSCYWKLPNDGEVKINSDGLSRGNPRKGGVGFIIRDHNGTVLRTYSKGLGTVTSYMAECSALLQGLQDATSNGWLIAWSESDYAAAVEVFNNDNVPWQLKGNWEMVKTKIHQIRISSTWREVNFSSNQLANRGAKLL